MFRTSVPRMIDRRGCREKVVGVIPALGAQAFHAAVYKE